MAELNLLQGKFTGRLGELSGSTWKGKNVIRAAPFSKAPPTPRQTENVRAFECLNRLSSAIAKAGWVYLGLSAKGLHRHNAVARWLKPVVKDHRFQPSNISEVIPAGNNILLTAWTLNRSSGVATVRIDLAQGHIPPAGSKLFVVVFDDTGRAFFAHCGDLQNFSTRIYLETFGDPVYSLMAFITEPAKKGYRANNFLYKRGTGMRYSLEEQPTGDLWIDGRPIYQKTYAVTYGQMTNNNLNITVAYNTGIGTLIHAEFIDAGNSATMSNRIRSSAPYVTFSGTPPSLQSASYFFSIYFNQSGSVLMLRISSPTNLLGGNGHLTVRYTKSSDQPVVDG